MKPRILTLRDRPHKTCGAIHMQQASIAVLDLVSKDIWSRNSLPDIISTHVANILDTSDETSNPQ